MNKTALTISAVLTTFILILASGVAYAVNSARQAEVSAQDSAPVAQPIGEQVQQAILEREATYQETINQANARLQQMEQDNQTLQEQVNILTGVTAPAAGSETVSSEQAIQIATQFLGVTEDQVYEVIPTTFDGIEAYQIAFNSGEVVIVATDGAVLAYFPPSMPPVLSGVRGSPSRSQGGGQETASHEVRENEEHEEHEGSEHNGGESGDD